MLPNRILNCIVVAWATSIDNLNMRDDFTCALTVRRYAIVIWIKDNLDPILNGACTVTGDVFVIKPKDRGAYSREIADHLAKHFDIVQKTQNTG